jgi:hypothetical protein
MSDAFDDSRLEARAEPVYRVRIAHDSTVKEGHRVKETTVEATFAEADIERAMARLDELMARAYTKGRAEVLRRIVADAHEETIR